MKLKLNLKQNPNQKLGVYGEDLAIKYLQKKGYRIITRNFKINYGEIDIIATYQNILVFVEVKTRISTNFGLAEEAVTSRKIKELIHTSEVYVLNHPNCPKSQRMDAIAIDIDRQGKLIDLRHIENITS